MAEEKQDGQKTLVAFVVGLLIGGMLVWAFSGPNADAPQVVDEDEQTQEEIEETSTTNVEDGTSTTEVATEETTPTLAVGEGKVVVNDQPAGTSIALTEAVYPVSEGWIGVREFNNDQLGFILGVVRFSESQGLVPKDIVLQRPTTAGNQYAVVIYTEDGAENANGKLEFNLAGDVQIDTIFDTFTAK